MQLHVLRMEWQDLLFASWPLPPRVLSDLMPKGLQVDMYEGEAWVSLVALKNADMRVRGAPRILGMDLPELNLRTYVMHEGTPGILFFTLDAQSWFSVMAARLGFQLPYHHAKTTFKKRPEGISFRSVRDHPGSPDATFEAFYRGIGEKKAPEAGSLDAFLLERYRFFTRTPLGLARLEVEHEPWRYQEVDLDIRRNTVFQAHGLPPPEGPPVAHYVDRREVTGTPLLPVQGPRWNAWPAKAPTPFYPTSG